MNIGLYESIRTNPTLGVFIRKMSREKTWKTKIICFLEPFEYPDNALSFHYFFGYNTFFKIRVFMI